VSTYFRTRQLTFSEKAGAAFQKAGRKFQKAGSSLPKGGKLYMKALSKIIFSEANLKATAFSHTG